MAIDENRIREIVREELENALIKSLTSAVEEMKLLLEDAREKQKAYEQWTETQKRETEGLKETVGKLVEGLASLLKLAEENTRAIQELRKQTEENTKAIQELRKVSEENTRAIQELRKQTEENTRAIQELRKVSEENTKAIIELRKQTEENTKAIQELRKVSEENTRAIQELRKQTEENTRAIQELRKQTEENTKQTEENTKAIVELRKTVEAHNVQIAENTRAIAELRKTVESLAKQTEENTRAIQELRKISEENTRAIIELRKVTERLTKEVSRQGAKLDKAVKNINKRIGGLENTFGLIIEDQVRKGLTEWFKLKGVEVNEVRPKVIKIGDKAMEFDAYVEVGNKVYVAEVKTTLRVRDVKTFNEKVNLLRNYLKDKEVIPVLVYRLKSGDVEALAKGFGITVLKYMKGGYFEER